MLSRYSPRHRPHYSPHLPYPISAEIAVALIEKNCYPSLGLFPDIVFRHENKP